MLTDIGTLPLNAVVMQDDIAKMNDNLEQARDGCNKIHNTLMRKQLSVNHEECKYMIVGPKKFRENTLKTGEHGGSLNKARWKREMPRRLGQ